MKDEYDFDLVCIGSGPAGQRCAVQASKLGQRVAVIEKRRCVGGVCLETGTIPSKTFREAVRLLTRQAQQSGHAVPTAGNRPTIADLLRRVNHVISHESQVQRDQMQRNDIELIFGKACFLDPHRLHIETDLGSRIISAAKVMIAVGTHAADPPNIRPDGRTVINSDGVMDLTRLPKTLAVVGAGVIGIEYASMFAALGLDVVVVDKRTKPLEFLDYEIIDEMVHRMRKMEVTFRLGEGVKRVEVLGGNMPQGLIELESGKRIVADLILFSVGRQGATESLNLEAADLKADDRGRLKVNEFYQTAVPHIYAAGDVIGFPALAATSAEQGRLAACHMFGAETKPMASHFPIGIYSIPEISMVGQTEEELTKEKIPYETGIAKYREIARGLILGDQDGMLKLIFHRETRKLLGAHVLGTGSTELIHVGQAVMRLGGGLDYFLETVFNYPTLAECYKVAALNAANKLRKEQMFRPVGANGG